MKTENSQHLEDKAEVLIALAAQQSEAIEHPPSPEELADFFANSKRFSKQRQDQILAYLDSNPQAYERWIQQGRKAEQTGKAQFSILMTPYAIATVVLLLMLGVGLLWLGQEFKLNQAIDRSYNIAVFNDNPESFRHVMESLNETLQQSERPLSFSFSDQSSPLAQAFILGLQHDWRVWNEESSGNDLPAVAWQESYQLGRWYALLWTVSQQDKVLSADFWQKQLKILDQFQTYYAELAEKMDTTEVSAVVLQLGRMETILRQLAEGSQVAKSYRQLEQVLDALRFSFIHLL